MWGARSRTLSGVSEILRFVADLFRRTVDHELIDMAAKIAYYSFLSLFPLILVLFALTGLLGGEAAFEWTMDQLKAIMPRDAAEYIGGFVHDVTGVRRPDVLGLSIAFLIFSASGAVVALIESLNVIFEIGENRPLWRKYLLAFMAIVATGFFYMVGVPTILAGPGVLELMGFGWLWGWFSWPLVFGLLTLIVWLAYIRLPNHRQTPSYLMLLVGALVGTALWAVATQGLQLYMGNFERFANLYGVVTGIMVTMIWLHMSAFALLLGAQVAGVLAIRVERRQLGREQ